MTIGADDSVEEALHTMADHEVRWLPVIDGHELIGIVGRATWPRTSTSRSRRPRRGDLRRPVIDETASARGGDEDDDNRPRGRKADVPNRPIGLPSRRAEDVRYGDGDTLPVLGSPAVMPQTGPHRRALLPAPARPRTVIAGDAIVTQDPYTGRAGPRLVARTALTGHGTP